MCNRRIDKKSDTPSLSDLIGLWLAEKEMNLRWQIVPGHPHHVLRYQKLHSIEIEGDESNRKRAAMAYYMVIEDDKVVDSQHWNNLNQGKQWSESQQKHIPQQFGGTVVKSGNEFFPATDPEFFTKLQKRMEEVMRRIG